MVLPPGYEDILLCPPAYCLADKKHMQGFAGPKSAFHYCHSLAFDKDTKITAWGSKTNSNEELQQLIQKGYSAGSCQQFAQAFTF